MSKIRNLFKKILSKKKSSQELDDIFIDDVNDDEIEDILDDDFEEDFDQTKTNFIANEPDINPDEEELVASPPAFEENSEEESDDDFEEENFDEDFTGTREIDLDEGSLTLRDRMEHLGTRVKDRFRNLNKKDLNQAYKNEESEKTGINRLADLTKNINLDDLKTKASSFNWAALPTKFFSEQNKAPYHRYFQIAMVVFTTFAIAQLAGSLFSGDKKYNEMGRVSVANIDDSNRLSTQDLSTIADSQLFKTAEPKIEKPKEDRGPTPTTLCKAANKKSNLSIQLVDTIVLQDSVKSIAAVQLNSKKDLTMAREGDELNNMKVGKIEKARMIFRNLQSQDCEYIEQKEDRRSRRRSNPPRIMSPTKANAFKREQKEIKGIKQDGNNFTVERSFLKNKLSDINTILTEAKGIMIKNPDGTVSFKIVQVDPGGIFAYLGVQENDVINTINGEPIKELNDVMNLFGKLPTLNKLELGFDRGGQAVDQKYKIE